MNSKEKRAWETLITIYGSSYQEFKKNNPKGEKETSKKFSNRILLGVWRNRDVRLGGFFENYQDYYSFEKMFFRMRNKKRRGNRMEKRKTKKSAFQRGYVKAEKPQKSTPRRKHTEVQKPQRAIHEMEDVYYGVPAYKKPKPYEELDPDSLNLAE